MNGKTPLAAVSQGLLAGLIGNAVFTGYQTLQAKLASPDESDGSQEPPKDWSETPEPAQSVSASWRECSRRTSRSRRLKP